jgi:8-oxo-dGTP pyrophosphatase MutT (NUDIX family)
MVKVKDLIIAAGGIVIRDGLVLLVYRPRYGDWSFPKGKLDCGESPLETAIREVGEETGCEVEVRAFAGAVGYLVKDTPKTVLFWVMEAVRQGPIQDRAEVSELVWLPVEEAARKLTYPLERDILERLSLQS